MILQLSRGLIVAVLCAIAWCSEAAGQDSASARERQRRVAVTIDDFPAVSTTNPDVASHRYIATTLIAKLSAEGVPATGFVIEKTLRRRGEPDTRRVALLEQWLDAGFELGNHSYSHLDFNIVPRAEFQDDVVRGEEISSWLLSKKQKHLRYFRYPFLHTGTNANERKHFEQFLEQRGYTPVPVTIDASDWSFGLAYDQATVRGDSTLMGRIGEAYVQHTGDMFAFFEHVAHTLFGREPSQILLLHATALNAVYLNRILRLIRERGYRFISAEEALRDSIYRLPDPYTGPAGLSWLLRWAEARDVHSDTYGDPPEMPVFVARLTQPK